MKEKSVPERILDCLLVVGGFLFVAVLVKVVQAMWF